MPAKRADILRQDAASDAAALQTLGLSVMTDYGHAWTEAMGRVGNEVTAFVAERLKEDLKTQKRILGCTDMAALQSAQAEFFETAIRQYSEAACRIMGFSRPLFGFHDATSHTPV